MNYRTHGAAIKKGNGPSCRKKFGEFLDQVSNYEILKKYHPPMELNLQNYCVYSVHTSSATKR